MNTYPSNLQELEIKRRQLEQLWQPTLAERVRQVSASWLRTAGQWLVQTLTAGEQLRVWTKTTPQGPRWFVYNPMDGRHHRFDSEEAVRVWLEQRYNG